MSDVNEELQSIIENDPSLQEAFQNAQKGEFTTTVFEVWETHLDALIEAMSGKVTLYTADSILRVWPWLSHEDLDSYQAIRLGYLQDIKDLLVASYPKDRDELFLETENDWLLHEDAYIDILVKWSAMTNMWQKDWADRGLSYPNAKINHAVILDLIPLLLGQNSMIQHLQALKGFDISEERGAEIEERIKELSDE